MESPKKSSVSSRRGRSLGIEKMPELTREQLASFRPITQEEHGLFKTGIVRGSGRPKN